MDPLWKIIMEKGVQCCHVNWWVAIWQMKNVIMIELKIRFIKSLVREWKYVFTTKVILLNLVIFIKYCNINKYKESSPSSADYLWILWEMLLKWFQNSHNLNIGSHDWTNPQLCLGVRREIEATPYIAQIVARTIIRFIIERMCVYSIHTQDNDFKYAVKQYAFNSCSFN